MVIHFMGGAFHGPFNMSEHLVKLAFAKLGN